MRKTIRKPYAKYKKDYCEHCKFKALDGCQLDIDHIDGDHKNNKKNNLRTLCSNCHRLKTKLNKDYLAKNK
jgi:5-methylcytosine-specific restriction endonuclease McrA